ncbi:uncharacterized protein B0P05DRAFT_593971 [Gilbertella persicaria]|uniref:uncharacterized protein n=1 Tax=Gilbertella persicaria TaxID=101096 RepID=UPI00221F9117|nr:uncharacterized protein B0P05DRAFT_593971 [Gilbertella persicaria]KAI8091181.1 hypothetical protein B0P05DRAFT_593971 [Gilbertella persicaria]
MNILTLALIVIVQCTGLKESSNKPCTHNFCIDCIKREAGEDLEWIKENKTDFFHTNGQIIRHRVPRLSFNKKQIRVVQPPTLTAIDLIYSEQEIWTRLQIREFLFRFGDLYRFDHRFISPLQNVQGDWKIKRFGAYIVFQSLSILSSSTHFELAFTNDQNSLPQMAKKIINDWIVEKKINKYFLDTKSRHQALLDSLLQEGMSGKRWLDIAELLAAAQVKDIPIPTSQDFVRRQKDENDMDIDQDDEEEERIHAIELKYRRFQKSARSASLLSIEDELKLIYMLLEVLLFEHEIRQSLNTTIKPKELDFEFKELSKDFLANDDKNKSRKNALTSRITQLGSVRNKQKELQQAQIELDLLETHIRDERLNFESKKIERDVNIAKSQKRMGLAGVDHLGNEYWMFSNILDIHHANDLRNSETYWAYGAIVIGPGYEQQAQEKKWWFVKGKKDLTQLVDWLKQQGRPDQNESLISLASQLCRRVEHLTSLEWAVYGDGFFS